MKFPSIIFFLFICSKHPFPYLKCIFAETNPLVQVFHCDLNLALITEQNNNSSQLFNFEKLKYQGDHTSTLKISTSKQPHLIINTMLNLRFVHVALIKTVYVLDVEPIVLKYKCSSELLHANIQFFNTS